MANIDYALEIANFIQSNLETNCPKDKMNLVTTITVKVDDQNNAEITIGTNQYDYAHHTNRYWKIDLDHIRRKGKIVKRPPSSRNRLKSKPYGGVNPNYQWVDSTIEQCARYLAEANNAILINQLGNPK